MSIFEISMKSSCLVNRLKGIRDIMEARNLKTEDRATVGLDVILDDSIREAIEEAAKLARAAHVLALEGTKAARS